MSTERKRKIEWLNHFVGFVSVVLGVLMAFWLNSWNESRKESGSIETALQNIRNEIEKNLGGMDSIIVKNKRQRDMLEEYLEYIDEDMNVRVPKEKLSPLLAQYGEYLSTDGMGVRINLDLFQLSEVAWVTTHRTGILAAIDFELAFTLESAYDLQEKVNSFDDTIISELRNISGKKDSFQKIYRALDIEINLATQLKEREYPKALKAINEQLQH
ncbi:MAG: DUF6090 family protein [Cyclobacteriaceae bacterium]